jgi:hypothetical protein
VPVFVPEAFLASLADVHALGFASVGLFAGHADARILKMVLVGEAGAPADGNQKS